MASRREYRRAKTRNAFRDKRGRRGDSGSKTWIGTREMGMRRTGRNKNTVACIVQRRFHTYGTSCITPCNNYLNYLTPILVHHVDIYSFTLK
jgi:hypothetical protein